METNTRKEDMFSILENIVLIILHHPKNSSGMFVKHVLISSRKLAWFEPVVRGIGIGHELTWQNDSMMC